MGLPPRPSMTPTDCASPDKLMILTLSLYKMGGGVERHTLAMLPKGTLRGCRNPDSARKPQEHRKRSFVDAGGVPCIRSRNETDLKVAGCNVMPINAN
jgi:hypothetical protein